MTVTSIPPKDLSLTGIGPDEVPSAAGNPRDGHAATPTGHRRSIRHVATLLMSGALTSKILGFVREVLMAQVIGASLVADSFRGAITAVLLPLAFLQNEIVPAILIPMQRKALLDGRGPQHLAALTVALTAVAVLLMLAVQVMGQWWVGAVVGGFSAEGQALTLQFVQIMALSMPASTVLNCLAGGEIAVGFTRLTNIRAGLLNTSVIIGILTMATTGYVNAIAWSFAIAFNALALWALWSLKRMGMLSLKGVGPGMVVAAGMEFLACLRPLLALPIAEQGNIWIERILASRLITGAIASLDYARTLTATAVLLISQPLGLAVLSRHSDADTRNQIVSIARLVLAVAVPAAVFLAIFAPEVIRLVFVRGAFTADDAVRTSHALRGISFGLWASTLGWMLLRVLNSMGRNGTAALILVAAYAVNILFNTLSTQFASSPSQGLLFLGLGETMRGFVLLTGMIIAIEYRRQLLVPILWAAIPATVMAFLGWQVHEAVTGTIPRLAFGGLACLATMLVAFGILLPDFCRAGIRLVWMKLSPSGGPRG